MRKRLSIAIVLLSGAFAMPLGAQVAASVPPSMSLPATAEQVRESMLRRLQIGAEQREAPTTAPRVMSDSLRAAMIATMARRATASSSGPSCPMPVARGSAGEAESMPVARPGSGSPDGMPVAQSNCSNPLDRR